MVTYRNTKQREIILSVLQHTDSHPTAEWVFNKVRTEIPNISLGTVYRNLKHLIKMGQIVEFTCQGEQSKFDSNVSLHYHITCNICKEMIDIDNSILPESRIRLLEETMQILQDNTSYVIKSHCMRFRGICPDCLSKM